LGFLVQLFKNPFNFSDLFKHKYTLYKSAPNLAELLINYSGK
jgi:hypothetical protein